MTGYGFTSVFFPHDISKTDAARITKLDKEMFHDESWKPIYFGVKRSTMVKVMSHKKHCRRGSLHSCECWLLRARFWQQSRMLLRQSRPLIRHCCWCGRGFSHKSACYNPLLSYLEISTSICIAHRRNHLQCAQEWHVLEGSHSFTCHQHVYSRMEWTILPLLGKHSTTRWRHPSEVAPIRLQLTTHLSTSKGWKAKLA